MVKIITTIGPSSENNEILGRFKERGVDFFRINLSHTNVENIEEKIKRLQDFGVDLIIDTEGSQIRTGNKNEIYFEEGEIVKIYNREIEERKGEIFLSPAYCVNSFKAGDLISIDFDSLLLRVVSNSRLDSEGYVECRAVIGGKIGGRKAVSVDSPTFKLPPYSEKDLIAIELAKKHGIKYFTLSFMSCGDDVRKFKEIYPEAVIYSKIESKKGLENFDEILKISDGILIDRGDLGNEVALEKIPFVQKYIIKKVRDSGKEVFIATNTLEQMAFSLKPNKAEVNDIVNTLLDGATGIALTKETAVGKYPVEVVNTLSNLIKNVEFVGGKVGVVDDFDKYINSDDCPEMLIKPHGGKLVDRCDFNYSGEIPAKKISIAEEELMDLEQIGIGVFSPLEGFMCKNDFNSVVNNMKLSNGVVWPLPIVLQVNSVEGLNEGEKIALENDGVVYGILDLAEIYHVNKNEVVKKVYGTDSLEHPGVKKFMEKGDFFLGGKITLLKRRNSEHKVYELTPRQTRKIFLERGWARVLGFHTRNVIHKSHEFIQIEGMKKGFCDGLFVHPVIGKKKTGDFESEMIIKSYETMVENFYPKSKVLLGTFATYSRYGGPREAVFTALTRKNFGCSHFVVGRDHTGVGNFYSPKASHEIFDKFADGELGIVPVKFDRVFYSKEKREYLHELDNLSHSESDRLHISGTQAREMLKRGESPPEWFMRSEISNIILDKLKNGGRVFVE